MANLNEFFHSSGNETPKARIEVRVKDIEYTGGLGQHAYIVLHIVLQFLM